MIPSAGKYAVPIILACICHALQAQTDPCIARLNDAGKLIDNGRYDDGILMLQATIDECNFSSEDKIEAYKTLIIAYFETDQIEQAEDCARIILKINPKYRTNKLRDPVEIVELFEKFRPVPVFRLGLSGGSNFCIVEADNTYSIVSDDDSGELANYSSEIGFQIGIPAEYRIWRSAWIMAEFNFRSSNYQNSHSNVQGRVVHYNERLSYLDFPLMFRYTFFQGKFKPYVKFGTRPSYLLSAIGELSRDEISDLINRREQRNNFQFALSAGAGISFEHNSMEFRLDFNYSNYPTYVNKDGTRFQNLETIFRYYYLDNDFTIDMVQINLSLHYPIIFKNTNTK